MLKFITTIICLFILRLDKKYLSQKERYEMYDAIFIGDEASQETVDFIRFGKFQNAWWEKRRTGTSMIKYFLYRKL